MWNAMRKRYVFVPTADEAVTVKQDIEVVLANEEAFPPHGHFGGLCRSIKTLMANNAGWSYDQAVSMSTLTEAATLGSLDIPDEVSGPGNLMGELFKGLTPIPPKKPNPGFMNFKGPK